MEIFKINKFVCSLGFEPVIKDEELLARDSEGEYKVWLNGEQYLSFIGGRCELKTYGQEDSEMEDYTRRWQNYLIKHTPTAKRGEVRLKFRAENEANLYTALLNACEHCNDDVSASLETAEKWLELILEQEESQFSERLNSANGDFGIQKLIKQSQDKRADMGYKIHNIITGLLENKVERICNEKGEEVYNFTPYQLNVYDALVEMKETIDFAYRYQLYRTVLKSQQENQENN